MSDPNVILTNITPPRVPLTDSRTGLISREWYRFFFNLFQLTGSGTNYASLTDLQVGPPVQQIDLTTVDPVPAGFAAYASGSTQESQIAEIEKKLQGLASTNDINVMQSEVAEIWKQLQSLQVQPQFDIAAINAAIAATSSAPVTKTADFTVASNETWIINNKSGSTCTATLPTPSYWSGRSITFKNMQAQSLVSASSNVVPIDSTSAGTAILLPVIGNWATMVSDSTNWVIMQQAPNNILLLE
jgi:hypothetical protein